MQKNYYEMIEDVVEKYVSLMKRIVNDDPGLIYHGENLDLDGCVMYCLESDENNVHFFRNDDVLKDFYSFRDENNLVYEFISENMIEEDFGC